MRFELMRAEPIGLAVQRLNHSATQSRYNVKSRNLILFKIAKGEKIKFIHA